MTSGNASSPWPAAPTAGPAGPRRSPPAENPGERHLSARPGTPRSPVARNAAARRLAEPPGAAPLPGPCAPSSRACASPAAPYGPSGSSRATAPAPRRPRSPLGRPCGRTARTLCQPTGTSSGNPWPTCREWGCPKARPTRNRRSAYPALASRPGDAPSHSRWRCPAGRSAAVLGNLRASRRRTRGRVAAARAAETHRRVSPSCRTALDRPFPDSADSWNNP